MIATSVRTAKKMRACLVKSTRYTTAREEHFRCLLPSPKRVRFVDHIIYDITHRCAFIQQPDTQLQRSRDTQYVTGVGHPLEARWGRSPEARDSYFNLYSIPEKATEGRLKKKYL
ncbi:uncharacterized protein LOC111260734 isoform X2 [Varroa jacobsoni]|uniref:uncharacterized protein LOC111260734 isoform X2 n=1 Tax=Varroa jacobsoni TaxID=62625 RepID=UPI000BF95F71|nr:uncharacterized protein LOC111260734 isoform X2 [Varroa jacobsoni]